MRSRYRILEKRQAHFITGTIVVPGEARVAGIGGALALFRRMSGCQARSRSCAWMRDVEGWRAVQLPGRVQSQVQLGNEGNGSRAVSRVS